MDYLYFDKQGNHYSLGVPFVYGDIRYTSTGATEELFLSLGFTQVPIQPRPNDKFYVVQSYPNPDGSWNYTPRDLAELKAAEIKQIKSIAQNMLQASDWQVIRKSETGEEISPPVAEFRKQIRSCNNANEDAVNKCNSIEDLQALVLVWPEVSE